MAALTRDFGSPKTATIQEVDVTGTVTGIGTYTVTIELDVVDDTTPTPNHRYFYTTKDYVGTSATGPTTFTNDPVYVAITPQLVTTDPGKETVSVSVTGAGGAFTAKISQA